MASAILRYIAIVMFGIVFSVPAMSVSPRSKKSTDKEARTESVSVVLDKEPSHLAYINNWHPELPSLRGPLTNDESEVPAYVDDMINHAKEFLGLRYRRGGKTAKGFDCSGFMGYLFGQFGMKLNASSRSQYLQGESIDNEGLRPGDLVFFSGRRGGTKTVGHVGMVVEIHGDGTFSFIHSANSSGITISHSQEPYYRSRYVGARRVTE